MIATEQTLENLTLTINQEIHVQAPLDVTFAALLEQLGPGNETPDGKSLNMKIEPWPGGRWYRELGDGSIFMLRDLPSGVSLPGPSCSSSAAKVTSRGAWT